MKILFLPKYPRMGASSRLRTYQFLEMWKAAGFEVKSSSFFNTQYLDQIYAGCQPGFGNVLFCYLKRFFQLLSVFRYDLIWVEKELFPFFPSYAEWILEKLGKGYVVDYDDAVFHNYDHNRYWLVRFWMGNKIDWVMRHAQKVMVGNNYLKQRALKAGAQNIMDLPTVIDTARYQKKLVSENDSRVSVGWIGSPTTLKYLLDLKEVLESLAQELDFELIIINSKAQEPLDWLCEITYIPWSENTEVESILKMDIGLMPLPDNLWERGKCAYKLIQYMACGLPVVASPVGMNKDVVRHGENGFLATDEEEWIESLSKLISDSALRKKMGEAGRKLVEAQFTVEKNFEKMQRVISEL
jgi:glycosyltransferase involved in cell wall biosynthesis